MDKIKTAVLAIGIPVLLMLVVGLLLMGSVWLSKVIWPWLLAISAIVLAVDILILAPMALFQKSRETAGTGLVISSFVFGLTLWIWCLLLTYMYWGIAALVIGLVMAGVGVVPIAFFASLFNADWSVTVQIVILVVLTYGARAIGISLQE